MHSPIRIALSFAKYSLGWNLKKLSKVNWGIQSKFIIEETHILHMWQVLLDY